ncbi:hypothetical protein HK096_008247 [Nowakowskiella sp. JEL0078]|nr:hypothetical protein HK096_008247 [Nowakowskiella sp. JEL0078]
MNNTAFEDSWLSFWSGKLVPCNSEGIFVANATLNLPKLLWADAPEFLRTLDEKVLFYSRVTLPDSLTSCRTFFFSSHVLGSPSLAPLLQEEDSLNFALRIDYPHSSQISPNSTLNFSLFLYPSSSKHFQLASDSVPRGSFFGVLICNNESESKNMDYGSISELDIPHAQSQNSYTDIIKPEQILYELSQVKTKSLPIDILSPEIQDQRLNVEAKASLHVTSTAVSSHETIDNKKDQIFLPSIFNNLYRTRGPLNNYYGYTNNCSRYFDPFTDALQSQGSYRPNIPPFTPPFRGIPLPPFYPAGIFRDFYSSPASSIYSSLPQQVTDSNDEIVGALLLLSQPQQQSQKKEYKTKLIKDFLCPQCSRSFTRRFNLQTHLETHQPNRIRQHHCDECPKSFARIHDLKRHQNIHTNPNSFVCPSLCGKTFSRKDALTRHLVVKGEHH